MESLSEETWDVVISGTSIPQSLLALSLSRSDKKVLHVDRHGYYGGNDAGLSLLDAEAWVADLSRSKSTTFQDASIFRSSTGESQSTFPLASSRSYTLSLNPQIIYAQSRFLPTLVSSRIHTQLEFLAVGSWWTLRHANLRKIPSTREDVFNDESLSMKDKRGLMKFLRHVLQEEEGEGTGSGEADATISLQDAISTRFKIPESLQGPLLALALSPSSADSIPFDKALARIRRHMRSMGYFGQGFGAVIPKYGGNSEISQVACRAQAVGGGIYLLGQGLKSLEAPDASSGDNAAIECTLSDGTRIRSRCVIGGLDDLPLPQNSSQQQQSTRSTWRSMNVVADPLSLLFPPTSENGPNPAVAIVLVECEDEGPSRNPVYLQIHSEDTGECPTGQCVIYASVVSQDESAKDDLKAAVSTFLESANAKDTTLWTLSFRVSGPVSDAGSPYPPLYPYSSQVLLFPPRPHDVAFDDTILDTVKQAWEAILGVDAAKESSFLRFEERESEVED